MAFHTSGTVAEEREKNWSKDYWRVPSNKHKNNCVTHFGPTPLLVSTVANKEFKLHIYGKRQTSDSS